MPGWPDPATMTDDALALQRDGFVNAATREREILARRTEQAEAFIAEMETEQARCDAEIARRSPALLTRPHDDPTARIIGED
jgi:hypothetical protein